MSILPLIHQGCILKSLKLQRRLCNLPKIENYNQSMCDFKKIEGMQSKLESTSGVCVIFTLTNFDKLSLLFQIYNNYTKQNEV